MSRQDVTAEVAVTTDDTIDILAAAIRFYRSVVRRKWVVTTCLMISCALGGAYYVTATRLYESRAEITILNMGGQVLEQDSRKSEIASRMPDFERILQGNNVLMAALRALPHEHRIDFHNVPGDLWLQTFRNRLSISTLRNTNSLIVAFRSVHPETAYVVVDALLDAYLKNLNSTQKDSAQDLLRILTEEKLKASEELHQCEEQLLEARRRSQVLFGTGEEPTNVLNERVFALNQSLLESRMKVADARALLISLERAVQNGDDLQEYATKFSNELGTRLLEAHLGIGQDSNYTAAQLARDLYQAKADLSVKLESGVLQNHPAVIELQEKIRQLEIALSSRPQEISSKLSQLTERELGPRLLAIARRQYEVSSLHLQEIEQQFARERDEALEVGQQLAEVELLQREVATRRHWYNILLDTIKEKSLSKESGINAKAISPPSIDRRPVTPRLSITAMLSLFVGLVWGGMSVYVLDFFDDRFHSPDDLRQTLNAPILAMVRKLPELGGTGLELLYPFSKPNSVESEAFRSLRTAIDFSHEETRRLTISSTEPSDGKTTVLASLGVAFAQAGKRTLIIDGDMRRPGITRLFELSSQPGLSTVLRETRPVWECTAERILGTQLEELDVLPAGPRPVNPVELLSGDRFAELIGWAESQYDQILVDAPPSLAVADVQVIGRVVDAAILTVRPDKNHRKMVIRAEESLTALGCRLLGIVVNHVEPKNGIEYAYGYGYGYGYGEGYGHGDADADVDARSGNLAA